MKQYQVVWVETTTYRAIVDAENEQAAWEKDIDFDCGKEIDHELDVISVEEFADFVLDAATHPLQDDAHDK